MIEKCTWKYWTSLYLLLGVLKKSQVELAHSELSARHWFCVMKLNLLLPTTALADIVNSLCVDCAYNWCKDGRSTRININEVKVDIGVTMAELRYNSSEL